MLRAALEYSAEYNTKFLTFAGKVINNAMIDLIRDGKSWFEEQLISHGYSRVFLDDTVENEDGEELIIEEITSHGYDKDPTGKLAVLHLMLEKLRNRLEVLPPRQRRFLAYHFGLGTQMTKTIEETAAFFNLSIKFATEIEEKALKTLRDEINDVQLL